MVPYILLGSLLWNMILTVILVWVMRKQPVSQELILQNRELLNRIQAGDLKSYQILQTSSPIDSDNEYIPRDDESEANRVGHVSMARTMDAEEIKLYHLRDLGIGLDFPDEIEHR